MKHPSHFKSKSSRSLPAASRRPSSNRSSSKRQDDESQSTTAARNGESRDAANDESGSIPSSQSDIGDD